MDERSEPIIVRTWDWGPDERRRPGLPWVGIFLVVFGGLLLIERVLPEYRTLGNVGVLAAGLASLFVWALRRGTVPLYAGAFLTALALPGLFDGLGMDLGPGWGTIFFALAFLFVGAVRAARGGGIGWQLVIGIVLALLGASQVTIPGVAGLTLPLVVITAGLFLLLQARRG